MNQAKKIHGEHLRTSLLESLMQSICGSYARVRFYRLHLVISINEKTGARGSRVHRTNGQMGGGD